MTGRSYHVPTTLVTLWFFDPGLSGSEIVDMGRRALSARPSGGLGLPTSVVFPVTFLALMEMVPHLH
jgi:hypothetical protein